MVFACPDDDNNGVGVICGDEQPTVMISVTALLLFFYFIVEE